MLLCQGPTVHLTEWRLSISMDAIMHEFIFQAPYNYCSWFPLITNVFKQYLIFQYLYHCLSPARFPFLGLSMRQEPQFGSYFILKNGFHPQADEGNLESVTEPWIDVGMVIIAWKVENQATITWIFSGFFYFILPHLKFPCPISSHFPLRKPFLLLYFKEYID